MSRLGRKTRIGGKQREALRAIFERVRAGLPDRSAVTWSDDFGRLTETVTEKSGGPYAFAVIDEAQDPGVAEARFLAALAAGRNDGLFFAGDLGHRIFQQPFYRKAPGLDVRGRSHTLRINYRTSHQIRLHADRLLPATVSGVDGNADGSRGTMSMFDGSPPMVVACNDVDHECSTVGNWIRARLQQGCAPCEVGVFVRSDAELKRARAAVRAAGARVVELNDKVEVEHGGVAISTMHLAKGLEFRSVVVMACDDEVIPQSDRVESVADDADLKEIYHTERHLLYVACTRARDHLLVTGIMPVAEFVDDFLRGS